MLPQREIEQVKSISIVDFLTRNNVPSKRVGGSLLFSAPFRNDSTPSLKVDEHNRWYDFGTARGGDIIDLVKITNNTDFTGAVRILQSLSGLNVVAPSPSPAPASATPAIAILNAVPIYHRGLLDYLHERNVDADVAQKTCRQVHYRVKEKTYFALGFKNDSGGYELRSKYFKGCSGKDITTINPRANQPGDLSQCLVFEGFMDYLSYLTMNKHDIPRGWDANPNDSIVVLNSITNLPKAKPYLEQQFAVTTFLDNDDVGRQATAAIRRMVKSGHPVWNAAQCYAQHKDLNEYLMSLPRVRISPGNRLRR
jgi:hypothetical protein